ncbi:MAG: T9SS type A sorting domain-containing protein, partial [Chitinophagaceae bacterium]
AWTYGANHPFQFQYTAATGTAEWYIDFNLDGDFLDAEESAVSISASLVNQSFMYVNIWLQGMNVPALTATVNNFNINGVNFGTFTSSGSSPTEQLFEDATGNFNNILITGSVSFSGGSGQERPRFYLRLGTLIVLPNQLTSFTLKKTAAENILKWTTENETNTKEFQIERSRDGRIFQVIATVPAMNLGGTNHYQYKDNSNLSENIFYRLKTVNLDRQFSLSPLLRSGQTAREGSLLIYPNPTKGKLSIYLPEDAPAQLTIKNVSGTELLHKKLESQSGILDLSWLSPGIYIVSVYQKGRTTSQKFIIQ